MPRCPQLKQLESSDGRLPSKISARELGSDSNDTTAPRAAAMCLRRNGFAFIMRFCDFALLIGICFLTLRELRRIAFPPCSFFATLCLCGQVASAFFSSFAVCPSRPHPFAGQTAAWWMGPRMKRAGGDQHRVDPTGTPTEASANRGGFGGLSSIGENVFVIGHGVHVVARFAGPRPDIGVRRGAGGGQ